MFGLVQNSPSKLLTCSRRTVTPLQSNATEALPRDGGVLAATCHPISVGQIRAPRLGDLQSPRKDQKSSIARVGSDIHIVIADWRQATELGPILICFGKVPSLIRRYTVFRPRPVMWRTSSRRRKRSMFSVVVIPLTSAGDSSYPPASPRSHPPTYRNPPMSWVYRRLWQ